MMAPTKQKTIFDRVVEITFDYLGPAANRFIVREIEAHLGKRPDDLKKSDIPELADWCKLAIALLTDDKKLVDDFSERLLSLTRNGRE